MLLLASVVFKTYDSSRYYPDPLRQTHLIEVNSQFARRRPELSRPEAPVGAGPVGRPKLLFLDEPTVGLDLPAREMMWAMLRELVREGASIVLTTHYLEEAEALADRVVVLAKGRAIAAGTVNELRALVGRKRISCATSLAPELVAAWPGVQTVSRDRGRLQITASDAEIVVKRLVAADENFHELEVHSAGLAEAFTELTQELTHEVAS